MESLNFNRVGAIIGLFNGIVGVQNVISNKRSRSIEVKFTSSQDRQIIFTLNCGNYPASIRVYAEDEEEEEELLDETYTKTRPRDALLDAILRITGDDLNENRLNLMAAVDDSESSDSDSELIVRHVEHPPAPQEEPAPAPAPAPAPPKNSLLILIPSDDDDDELIIRRHGEVVPGGVESVPEEKPIIVHAMDAPRNRQLREDLNTFEKKFGFKPHLVVFEEEITIGLNLWVDKVLSKEQMHIRGLNCRQPVVMQLTFSQNYHDGPVPRVQIMNGGIAQEENYFLEHLRAIADRFLVDTWAQGVKRFNNPFIAYSRFDERFNVPLLGTDGDDPDDGENSGIPNNIIDDLMTDFFGDNHVFNRDAAIELFIAMKPVVEANRYPLSAGTISGFAPTELLFSLVERYKDGNPAPELAIPASRDRDYLSKLYTYMVARLETLDMFCAYCDRLHMNYHFDGPCVCNSENCIHPNTLFFSRPSREIFHPETVVLDHYIQFVKAAGKINTMPNIDSFRNSQLDIPKSLFELTPKPEDYDNFISEIVNYRYFGFDGGYSFYSVFDGHICRSIVLVPGKCQRNDYFITHRGKTPKWGFYGATLAQCNDIMRNGFDNIPNVTLKKDISGMLDKVIIAVEVLPEYHSDAAEFVVPDKRIIEPRVMIFANDVQHKPRKISQRDMDKNLDGLLRGHKMLDVEVKTEAPAAPAEPQQPEADEGN